MPSSSKTTRLKLNVWSASDSPMRNDFNSDNGLIDEAVAAIETDLAANGEDHAAIRAEFAADLRTNADDHAAIRAEASNLVSGASGELSAYARETRRIALDAYAMATASEVAAIEPGAGEAWVEDFSDLAEIDLAASPSARYFLTDEDDETINYIGAVCGHHPSYGDTSTRGSEDNIALPFTLSESCSITRIAARPVYTASFSGELNVTCSVYKATVSGSSYKLGTRVFTATKARPTSFPSGQTYVDTPVNYVDTPFTLAAGTYCVIFHGEKLRVNAYSANSNEGNPKLAPYDRYLSLTNGDTTAELTVVEGRYADASICWIPASAPHALLTTKLLGFDRAMRSAAVYVYCDTGDLQSACTVLGASGAGSSLTVDADMQNAPCADGTFVTKFTGTLTTALTDAKLRLGMYSPSVGSVRRILFVAMRTEV